MKRDIDLIRRIVQATAELPYGNHLSSLANTSTEEFVTHVAWLKEAGLVIADVQEGSGSFAKYALIFRLTWNGCEFADACADETLWNKAKEVVIKPGLSFTFDILKEWLKAEVKNGLPTIRGLAN